ncbi:hypothetical protein [Algoriphagus persicinus]|nr:hypothetical protein [Algoriphagus sp. E1-3-M2]MEB2787250.1 hypothetical protein [Algoriphagus sp. E1-3-M2]
MKTVMWKQVMRLALSGIIDTVVVPYEIILKNAFDNPCFDGEPG